MVSLVMPSSQLPFVIILQLTDVFILTFITTIIIIFIIITYINIIIIITAEPLHPVHAGEEE